MLYVKIVEARALTEANVRVNTQSRGERRNVLRGQRRNEVCLLFYYQTLTYNPIITEQSLQRHF